MRISVACLALLVVGLPLTAAGPTEPDSLPIGLTEEEKQRLHEIGLDHRPTAPPEGALRNPAEWEPSEGVLVRWPLGIPVGLVAEMSEDVVVTTIVASAQEEQSALGAYSAGGVNMAHVEFIHAPTNSIWVRDYGPWFIFRDDQPAIVDHIYNRPRPLDDVIPQVIGAEWGLDVYGMDLVHSGGNHMSDGLGMSSSTELVYHENTDKTPAEIHQVMHDYLGNEYTVLEYIQSGGIHHIDCWAKFLGPTTVLVKDVLPSDPSHDELNARAEFLSTQISAWGVPYTVVRIFCPPGTYYTNSLILNRKVLVPLFGHSEDGVALQVYRESMPGYEVLGFYGSWANEDALHCRAMGVPDRQMLFIDHVPFGTEDITYGEYDIAATLRAHSGEPLLPDELKIRYSVDGGPWQDAPLTAEGTLDTYSGSIPAQPEDSLVSYYLEAADESGRVENHPYVGRAWAHQFSAICPNHPLVDVAPDGPLAVCSETGQPLTANLTGGVGPFAYQWLEDGIEIPGATSATYSASDSGTHLYNCRVWGDGCVNPRTDADDVEVVWQVAPVFAGLGTVTNPQAPTCTLDLSWDAATPACDGPVYYTVYRSTTTGFIPGPGNRLVAGLAGTGHSDAADLEHGTTYHYIVRAEDDSNGAEDGNVVELSGTPTGPDGGSCTTGSACTMTVNVTPNGTTSVCTGDDAVFTASPAGGDPPYDYQWLEDGVEIDGATDSSFTANHAEAQAHTYNCKVTDSALCAEVVDGLDAEGAWTDCGQASTVPDGSEGGTTPLLVARNGSLTVSWDTTMPDCTSADYHLVWGWGHDVAAYVVSGSDCTLDPSGSHDWMTSPDTLADWCWFLVVGSDGSTTEGGWGTDSASNPRSTVASGECGTLMIDTTACLP